MELRPIAASDPVVRQAVALLKGTDPARDRLVVVEGLWAHEVLRRCGAVVASFLWCPEAGYSQAARLLAEEFGQRATAAYRISARTLARVSERARPDGLVSVVEMPTWSCDAVRLRDDALLLVSDGLETPGNLGTLIRTLDGVHGDCLLVTNRRTRLSHPKVFRGSHGMSLTVPALEFDSPLAAADWLRERRCTVYLAEAGGARSYRDLDYSGRTAVVVGSERFGIAAGWRGLGFERVAIPMLGAADSLNVSVAASILLYEGRARKAGW
jgi:tRNA G18 (ribose-2'-O)-methylase SpoU